MHPDVQFMNQPPFLKDPQENIERGLMAFKCIVNGTSRTKPCYQTGDRRRDCLIFIKLIYHYCEQQRLSSNDLLFVRGFLQNYLVSSHNKRLSDESVYLPHQIF